MLRIFGIGFVVGVITVIGVIKMALMKEEPTGCNIVFWFILLILLTVTMIGYSF